jgi:hypothetical protein
MFLLKKVQDNLNGGYGEIIQNSRYELMKQQILKEQEGILHTLEIYHSIITYFFYTFLLLSFCFGVLSLLSDPVKKISKFITIFTTIVYCSFSSIMSF